MPGVLHVVQLAFRHDANTAEVEKIINGLATLKENCVKGKSNEPYIASVKWGKDVSPEGAQNGFTHMFVFEFGTVEDRDYYLTDPTHDRVAKALQTLMDKVQVLDIEI